MRRITTPIVTLLLAHILIISALKAQTVSSTSNLSIFYPAGYDATQNTPSFAIQNEPVVTAGAQPAWRLNPSFYVSGGNNCSSVSCGTGVDFYGTGEVTGTLRRNNTSITLWNTDNFNYASYGGQQLYQSHPWVMGVRADGTAFGVIADNTWEMTIAISDTNIVFTSLGGPAFRVLTFEAASPQQAVEQLGALTGKISLPPIWSLGYHQCRYSYMSDTQVEGIADSFRVNQLPCDAIWMDINYMDQYKIFTFSPTGYPNPNALNSFLHTNNFHSVWMIDPGVKQEAGYNIYDQGTAGNYWVKTNDQATDYVGTVWPGNCVFPDFTMPATRTWWSGLYTSFMATGADGIWNDMNEPSVFNGPNGTMPIDNWHRGGGTLLAGSHLRYHNVFGRLMVQASRAGIAAANPTKRPFVLSRSNFLGGQQYAATWTGDNDATTSFMQLSIPMILTMGLSGQPMIGADVTGYSGSPTPDLVGQWMALGTFYPFYRNHSETGTPMREPWVNGPAIEQVCRIALQRRYRLLPYIYTLTQESTTDGLPIMRPLFFAEPTNASLRSQQQAFMLGDILMIVPKWATGVNSPSGVWTSISLVGEDSKNDPYQPNVLIKAGSILPLGQIIQSTANYNADSLSLIVSLDANNKAHGINYTDSGEGYSYQSGAYLMREFNIQPLGTDSLILTATVDSGSLSTATNRYRVGIVMDTGIYYTNWTSSNVIKIPLTATGEAPYGGTPWPIPGTIQAENYDIGGQGIAYYDTDSANDGGQYRTTESVDVETCTDAGGGYDVGYTATGEWEKYTVNVTAAGTYTLQARVASATAGNSLHVEIDGVNISGSISVPNTTGFQTWQTVSVTTPNLTVGQHIMRIYMETGGFNLNYVTFVLNTPAIPVVTSATLVGTVGTAFSYTISATNSPTSYAIATGTLPVGLTLNTSTGVISGTPTTVGTSTVTVTATNTTGVGTGTLTFTITNPSAPVITSANAASGVIGTAFSYTAVASNSPTGYTITGTFPPGLSFSAATISGTPTVVGTFVDTVKAINAGGTGVQIVTFTITALPPCGTSMVVNATSVPTIDGTVDPVWSNAPKNAITKTIQGTIQTGSTWQAMYDATNLYVLVQVKDANTSSVGTNVYDQDGVELFIAGNNNKTGTYTANDHQYRFNWNEAPTVANITGDAPLVTTGITYAIPSVTGGYNLEVAIPWTTIGGTPPSNGKAIGFDININDQQNNLTTREAVAGWNSTATDDYSNPGDFGTVNLTVCVATSPVVTPATLTGTVGTPFNYSIIATNNPTGYSSTVLPAGLTLNTTTGVISGTPTAAGSFSVTATATNAGGNGSGTLTITINPAQPVVTPATTTGTVGVAFSYTVIASNSPTSYSSTALPAGLTLNTSTGVISGTPTAVASTPVTITATNAGGSGTGIITITINPAQPVVTPATTSGTVGVAFSYAVIASNSPTSYSSTALPAGLTLNTSTGVISGTPIAVASTPVTITATNAGGSGTGIVAITINPAQPVVTPATTIGTVGVAFSYSVIASNNPTSYSSTALPAGLTFNTSTGVISGTPTAVASTPVTITATNAGGSGTGIITITINPAQPVVTPATTIGTVGLAFSYTVIASNSPTSYSSTALPAGLTLNTSTGVISGTPTAVASIPVTITATNAGGSGTGIITITINPAQPVVTPATTTGTVGVAFSYAVIASNSPISYSSTALPAGLTLNTSTGVISGTPTAVASTPVTITETNAGGSGTGIITITINPAQPVVTPATTTGTVGVAFSYAVIASNSPTSYSSTALPAGLTLNTSTGVISGTPTAVASTPVTITATNAGGSGTGIITITINSAIPVVTPTTVSGTTSVAFSYTISATNSPTSYSSTALPAGLTLNTTTGVISGTPTTAGSTAVTVSATNISGTGTGIVTINITTILPPPPVVTPGSASGTVGTAFSYSIIATNSPTGYSSTTLPAGLTLNSSGVISGTPITAGIYTITDTATNAGGSGTGTITITINPAQPVVTPATTIGTVGVAFSYTVIASNSPTSYSSTVLPAGLTLNTTTGVISGTPTTVASTPVTITATNAGGNGTGIVTITINPAQPVVTPATAAGTVGIAFSYTIIASNSPTSYSSTALPAGLTLNTSTGVISGTPTAVASTPVTITATNAGGSGTGIVTINITVALPPVPVVTPATTTGTVGIAFSYTIIASNSPTSYSSTVLPAGLVLNATTGVISGTPTAVASTPVTITATNAGGSGIGIITITINPAKPVVTSATTTGTVGVAFSYTVIATNSPTSYSSTVLPAGLILNTTTGVISGTPTTIASTPVTITATNAGGSGTGIITITINPAKPVVTSATTTGTVGVAFSYTVIATNSPTSYSSTVLPAGLILNTTTGVISGTPTTIASTPVTITATNAGGSGTGIITITINPAKPVVTSATITGTVGVAFSYTVIASNTPTNYSSTALPSGLTLNTTTGVISGTPITIASTPVTITATNAGGSGTGIITITINPAKPAVTSATTTGTVGVAFRYTIIATNTSTSYSSTALPAGLTLNATTGIISGTPTTVASTPVTITATNAGGSGTGTITITINPAVVIPVPVITSNGSISGIVGIAFEYGITATNSPSSFTSTVLPAGLSLNTITGEITGTPIVAGVFTMHISATNAGGISSLHVLTITLTIPLAPVITSDTVETVVNGKSFTYNIEAENDATSYGATGLPQGLTIDTTTGEIDGTVKVAGTFNIILKATNAVGTGTKILVLTVTNSSSKGPITIPFVFPSPIAAGATLTFALPGWLDDIVNIEIINSLGKVVGGANNMLIGYSSITNTPVTTIIIGDLVPGDYIIIVRGDKGKVVSKFMVK